MLVPDVANPDSFSSPHSECSKQATLSISLRMKSGWSIQFHRPTSLSQRDPLFDFQTRLTGTHRFIQEQLS
jgi:hypothetical protein